MSEARIHGLWFGWCTMETTAEDLATFFVRHVDTEYISHGELQCGRASAPTSWVPNLAAVVRAEFVAVARLGAGRLAYARAGDTVVAVAVTSVEQRHTVPFAVIEDLVVARDIRNTGVGRKFLEWIEMWAIRQGCRQLFLESGVRNAGAHRFFERRGYVRVSLSLFKELGAGDSVRD